MYTSTMTARNVTKTILLFIAWSAILPNNANAYIEPGIMVAIWQLLLAGLVGAIFFIKTLRIRITQIFLWVMHFFKKRPKNQKGEIEVK